MIPKKLLDEISRWMNEGKYGNLQINFSGGKIMSVNRVESVKVEMLFVNNPAMNIDCTTSRTVDVA